MKEIIIDKSSENQRFDKFLKKYFKEATGGFLYKMLRKKNITLNGKKADGREILKTDDVIRVFFSDETFSKMKGDFGNKKAISLHVENMPPLDILFENEDFLAVNKQKNLLSQKAKKEDISLNEMLLSYLYDKKKIKEESLHIFRPSVMNRLDRNTTGIVLFAKTLKGAQFLSEVIKDKDHPKIYRVIVKGCLSEKMLLKDYLIKDESNNTVSVLKEKTANAKEIITGVKPLFTNGEITLAEVSLYTGRTHQIRAHLSFYGYPVIGDSKYGDKETNFHYKNKFKVTSQLLHAYGFYIPTVGNVTCNPPKIFDDVLS
ncbi:MAG: RluA family pseudouridine synthase [Lachnospiraceae bacterium]|nr:RluA family pseudouridine synthase [Lachnospiraceae bacterium]